MASFNLETYRKDVLENEVSAYPIPLIANSYGILQREQIYYMKTYLYLVLSHGTIKRNVLKRFILERNNGRF